MSTMQEEDYERRKLALIDEITAAFEGVSREGGVSLSESWVIDNRGSAAKRAKAREQDTDTRRQDVPEEDIDNGYSCLSFMDPTGFRYYIPAYMVWFLRHVDDEPEDPGFFDSNTFDYLIYSLGGTANSPLDEFYLSRYRPFTSEQKRAIARFLEFEEQRQDEANAAWDSWQQEDPTFEDSALEDGEPREDEGEGWNNSARIALERYWGQFLYEKWQKTFIASGDVSQNKTLSFLGLCGGSDRDVSCSLPSSCGNGGPKEGSR